jgi:hypothetical protein
MYLVKSTHDESHCGVLPHLHRLVTHAYWAQTYSSALSCYSLRLSSMYTYSGGGGDSVDGTLGSLNVLCCYILPLEATTGEVLRNQ